MVIWDHYFEKKTPLLFGVGGLGDQLLGIKFSPVLDTVDGQFIPGAVNTPPDLLDLQGSNAV